MNSPTTFLAPGWLKKPIKKIIPAPLFWEVAKGRGDLGFYLDLGCAKPDPNLEKHQHAGWDKIEEHARLNNDMEWYCGNGKEE